MVSPWEVSELEIQERSPSTLINVNGGALGGAGARDSGASTINVKNIDAGPPGRCQSWRSRSAHYQRKKHRRRTPWEVPELEIHERPLSTLRNIDGSPPGRCRSYRSGRAHYQHKNIDGGTPGGVGTGVLRASAINAKKHQRWAPSPHEGGGSDPHPGSERCGVNLHRHDRKKSNSTHRSHSLCT
jgi:hypothetical protein